MSLGAPKVHETKYQELFNDIFPIEIQTVCSYWLKALAKQSHFKSTNVE